VSPAERVRAGPPAAAPSPASPPVPLCPRMSPASQPSPPSRPAAPAGHRPAPSRDFVTTIRDDGSRLFLHPADARGRFTRWRRLSGLVLVVIYLALPWIPINGAPAVFLDIAGSRFHLFGLTFAAQDTWLLFFGVSGLGFALFFTTALFGRLWCGWACPQTVFLEHLYRPIERLLEGDAPARRALDAAPLSVGKFARRTLKHGLYVVVSLVITHLFLAYYVSLPEVWSMMRSDPHQTWAAFVFVFVAAGILYFNFAWFREQLCIVICPYGRLQSTLTDDHSLVIGYDGTRGEPRGKLGTAGAGACVDCHRCVQVCPTGIDIRHGLQLECIACAACVDACDEVMAKLHRPAGLVRYDSLAGFAGGRTRWVRPRTIVYGFLLALGVAVAGFAFSTVKPAGFMIMRMSGSAYFASEHEVRNQFMVRLVNKRGAPATLAVTLDGLPRGVEQEGLRAPVTLGALGETLVPLILRVEREHYTGPFHFRISVQDAGRAYTLSREVEFLGPDPRPRHADDDHEPRPKH